MSELVHKYVLGERDFYWKIIDDIMMATEYEINQMHQNRKHEHGFTREELEKKNAKFRELFIIYQNSIKESLDRIAQHAFDKGRKFERAMIAMDEP